MNAIKNPNELLSILVILLIYYTTGAGEQGQNNNKLLIYKICPVELIATFFPFVIYDAMKSGFFITSTGWLELDIYFRNYSGHFFRKKFPN